MLAIDASDLMTGLTFSELDGWEGDPASFICCMGPGFTSYVKNRETGGEEIAQFLRSGLKKMSLKKLTQLCIDAGNESYVDEPNSHKVHALMEEGVKIAVA